MPQSARNQVGQSGKKANRARRPFNALALRQDATSADCHQWWRFMFKMGDGAVGLKLSVSLPFLAQLAQPKARERMTASQPPQPVPTGNRE
jgi:hypothetical protein